MSGKRCSFSSSRRLRGKIGASSIPYPGALLLLLAPIFSLRYVCGEKRGFVASANDHARRERGEFGPRELFRVGEVEGGLGVERSGNGRWWMIFDGADVKRVRLSVLALAHRFGR